MRRDLAFAGPPPRAVCRRCRRPAVVCYCAALTTIDTKTRVVILQHPRERDMPIGTARMATLCLPKASLHVGVRWDESDVLRDATSDPTRPAILLWPGPDARDVVADPPAGPVTLVMVDGTWPQARTLVRDNKRLAALPRYAFTPATPSQYRIRREPRQDYVSTIEALMHVLGALEGDPPKFAALLEPLRAMVDAQIARCAAYRTPRKMNPRPPRPRPSLVPREVIDRFEDLVCVAAEGNAWPYAVTGVKQGHEILHWAAVRPATGETFDVVVAPLSPLAPGTSRHAGLDDARVAGGVSKDDLRAAFARFLRPSDVVCSWGDYAPALFEESVGLIAAARLDVRVAARRLAGVAGRQAGKVGTLESYAERTATEPPSPRRPRAVHRAALLARIVGAWHSVGAARGSSATGTVNASVRLYGDLGDFVADSRRGVAFDVDVGARRSVKDLIESVGVPHCEIGLVLVDGESVLFDRVVLGGERIAVYPHFADIDVAGLVRAGDPPPAAPRFVLDGHLGRLAAYLRAMGFDVVHDRDADDAAIARVAADEDRIVLTRDVGLLKRSLVRHGAFVRSTAPRGQLAEVVRRFRIADSARPFTRCLRCNTPFVPLPNDAARDRVPPRVYERFDEFVECPTCLGVFWRGTHHAALGTLLTSSLFGKK